MTEEEQLLDKLRRVEALFERTPFDGEKVAAANAMERIRERLGNLRKSDPPVEFKFTMRNTWSRRLLTALMRRYGVEPYRHYRQHYTTVMARVPKSFVDETLWPEFLELDKTLVSYLDDVTARVISQAICSDSSEAEVKPEPVKELPHPPVP